MKTEWSETAIRKELARLDEKTGLHGARLPISFSRAYTIIGQFSARGEGEFRFSTVYFRDPTWPVEEALNVIRHEYAHYMDYALYDGVGHGSTWKKCCTMIGAVPQRCYSSRVARLLKEKHDEEAKQQLIVHNLRLVVYIAKKFESTGINVEDLISIGTIGLIKAVNTFSPEKNIKLATYASRCIENEILMYLRRNSKTKTEVSIDEPLNVDWDGNELLLSDILGTDDDVISRRMEDEVEIKLLGKAINKLSPREQMIIKLRFVRIVVN